MTLSISKNTRTVYCSDGTVFMLQSESVRGEGTFHWTLRREPGMTRMVNDEDTLGSVRKQTAWEHLVRRAKQWEANL